MSRGAVLFIILALSGLLAYALLQDREPKHIAYLIDYPDTPVPNLARPSLTAKSAPPVVSEDYDIPPLIVQPPDNPYAIINPETELVIADMITQVRADLRKGQYGVPGEQAYNIVYLFLQSLEAYQRFLLNPNEGPDFSVFEHRRMSGSYNFKRGEITVGRLALENREGRFLATLFHEYQHHLFHTIYGTPERTDIVHKFYNELAAHMLEALFSAYLPKHYFARPHRGGYPQLVVNRLKNQKTASAIELLTKRLIRKDGTAPVYRFLMPVWDGYIEEEELLSGIDQSFHPDPEAAEELHELSKDYWGQ